MSYYRKRYDKEKYKKLYKKKLWYPPPVWYDEDSHRYIRIWKSKKGRNSPYSFSKRESRRAARRFSKKFGYYEKNVFSEFWW